MVSTWAYDFMESEDVELALRDVDALPATEPQPHSGRRVYQAGYEEGFKAGRKQERTGRWIPCSERLPDVGAILISDGNQMFIGAYYGNNTWSADGCDYDPILENIAWMPLPELWKGGAE